MINYKTASGDDLSAILDGLAGNFFTMVGKRKEFSYVIKTLNADEYPMAALAGDQDGLKGTLILLTNINIHFVRINIFNKKHHYHFSVKSLNEYEHESSFLFAKLTLKINYQEYTFQNIDIKSLDNFILKLSEAQTVPQSISDKKPSPQYNTTQNIVEPKKSDEPKSPVVYTDNLLEKLNFIKKIKALGAIDDREFDMLKKYILASKFDKKTTIDFKMLVEYLSKMNEYVSHGDITKEYFTDQKAVRLQSLLTGSNSN
ncbi:phage protein [Xenorhabdus mauleonii]|uniref:Phage protein n=1 Tax=Xenorhabdus mauleonii TaxID=351675 RepID=A0A1I3XSB3_9GAMM|nr:hypothetical protein [Xenorhabdus mauleonii]PHM36289.1 phage protein [Xenorhabdus mauleonii]SFK22422.1 hypothetical protein SAMN05421680_13812 [Xenorhabdus mauleonii]